MLKDLQDLRPQTTGPQGIQETLSFSFLKPAGLKGDKGNDGRDGQTGPTRTSGDLRDYKMVLRERGPKGEDSYPALPGPQGLGPPEGLGLTRTLGPVLTEMDRPDL